MWLYGNTQLIALTLYLQVLLTNYVQSALVFDDNNEALFRSPKRLVLCSMFGGKSHIKLHLEVGRLLKQRGHEVIYASSNDQIVWASPYNISTLNLGENPVSDELNRNVTAALTQETLSFSTLSLVIHAGVGLSYEMVYKGLKSEFERIRPDLVICDYLVFACFDLANDMGILYAGSFPTFAYVDQSLASYITNRFELLPPTTDSLTFLQKLVSAFIIPITKKVFHYALGFKINHIRKTMNVSSVYGHSWQKLHKALIFVDTFFGFDSARPIPPLVQPIGPVVHDNFLPLEGPLLDFFKSKQQIVYVAFGTIVYLDSQQVTAILEGLLSAVDRGVIDGIIWSLVSTQSSLLPKKVRIGDKILDIEVALENYPISIVNYAPQVAILRSPSTKIFISHCGIESTFEGLYSGVPFLAIPFFGDQLTNAGNLVARGVALAIDRSSVTSEKVLEGIKALSDSELIYAAVAKMKRITYAASFNKYRAVEMIEQTMFLSSAIKDEPLGHLVTQDNYMSWFAYSNMDVYSFLIFFLITISFLTWKVLNSCYYNPKITFKHKED